MTNLPISDTGNDTTPQSPFERIKRLDPNGVEYWSARDLMPLLEYAKWDKFRSVLLKAQIACENSGQNPDDHIRESGKVVEIGSKAKRAIEYFDLSPSRKTPARKHSKQR